MRIVTYKIIQEFSDKHQDARIPLNLWFHTASAKKWNNFNEVKRDFSTVDYLGNHRYVFNIKGNDYRLLAIISFNAQKVYIRFLGTHSEYDKVKDTKSIQQ